jgi:3'(2'), 5'-bisphosphate nucleotidase
VTPDGLLDLARLAALAGGRAILPFVGRPVPADAKADGSPLTAADLAAHRVILEVLAPSGLPVLSEESDPDDVAGLASWTRFWCVDPLDGTREFVAGRPEFTVNVALVDRGVPVLGVVHVPVSGVTYGGSTAGAWKETPGVPRVAIRVREPETGRLVVVASRSHAGPAVDAVLAAVRADGVEAETASMGSSLKFCLVAEGAADLYPRSGPTMAWDTAAAQAVVEAAGGRVSTWSGRRLTVDPARLLNPPVVTWGSRSVADAWPRWSAGATPDAPGRR